MSGMMLICEIEPGGYIQWEEPNDDAGNRPLVKSDPETTVSENSEELMKRIDGKFRSKMPSYDPPPPLFHTLSPFLQEHNVDAND